METIFCVNTYTACRIVWSCVFLLKPSFAENYSHHQGFFVMVRAGTAYREMKMRNVYLYVSIAVLYNKSWCTGTFSREIVRMYKNRGDQNIFPKNWVERNFALVNNGFGVATPSIALIYSSRTASPIITYSSRRASPVYDIFQQNSIASIYFSPCILQQNSIVCSYTHPGSDNPWEWRPVTK